MYTSRYSISGPITPKLQSKTFVVFESRWAFLDFVFVELHPTICRYKHSISKLDRSFTNAWGLGKTTYYIAFMIGKGILDMYHINRVIPYNMQIWHSGITFCFTLCVHSE